MKMTKVLMIALCGMLCVGLLSCASSGGGQAKDPFGPGVPYVGTMIVFDDGNDGGDSTIELQEIEVDGQPAYKVSGNVTTAFQYGFVGWMFEPDAETLAILKTAKAISFRYIGDGQRNSVKYRISNVQDHAHFEYHFGDIEDVEPGVPQRLVVPVEYFGQPAWGRAVRFNQDNAEDVSWQTHEEWRPGPFEITIWDVRIHP